MKMNRYRSTPEARAARLLLLASAGAVAFAGLALGAPTAGWAKSARARPADGTAAPNKTAKKIAKATPLRVDCAEALADGTLTDAREAEPLVNLIRQARPKGEDRPAAQGRRDVRLFCGPDLDGDGDREAILQVTSWAAAEATDQPPTIYSVLLTRHLGAWRVIADLGIGVADDQQAPGEAASFVRHANGKPALRIERAGFTSDNGCRIVGYELFTLTGGALRQLEAGDASPPCTPCGCDPTP